MQMYTEMMDEDTTLKVTASYRPEGNEDGIVKEYLFQLDADHLTDGLIFPEEEATLRSSPPAGRFHGA